MNSTVFTIQIEVFEDGSVLVEDMERKIAFANTYWYDIWEKLKSQIIRPSLPSKGDE